MTTPALNYSELLLVLQDALHALQICRHQIIGSQAQRDADMAIDRLTKAIVLVVGEGLETTRLEPATPAAVSERGLISDAIQSSAGMPRITLHNTTSVERSMARSATPILTADGHQTGWRYVALGTGDGVFVLSEDGERAALVIGDSVTGGENQFTAIEKAQQFASANPYSVTKALPTT